MNNYLEVSGLLKIVMKRFCHLATTHQNTEDDCEISYNFETDFEGHLINCCILIKAQDLLPFGNFGIKYFTFPMLFILKTNFQTGRKSLWAYLI